MRRFLRSSPVLPAALLALAPACGGGAGGDGEVRNALLITLDTTRYDALGFLGAEVDCSPRLDALAAESVVYEQARTVAPLTLPAHASMLTGLVPPRHTVRANGREPLPDAAVTVAETARERGLATAAFVSAVVLDEGFGLAQGFDVYDAPSLPAVPDPSSYGRRSGAATVDRALEWLRARDRSEPFLLWVHLFDPHLPFAEHDDLPAALARELEGLGPRGGYLAEVYAMDRAIGRLVDALRADGALDETLVVVVADHGEGQGQHREPTHGTLAFDSTMRVPMFVRHPDGWRAGERSDRIASVVDVLPTIAEALGLPAPGIGVDGVSLYRRAIPSERGAYLEAPYGALSFGWSPLVGWVDEDGKYLHSAAPALYALGAEGEGRNVLAARADDAAGYRERLRAMLARPAVAAPGGGAEPSALDASIAALGYAGAARAGLPEDPLAPTDRPSPFERRDAYLKLLSAQDLVAAGRLDDAVALYREVVAGNDANHTAWFELGGALVRLERWEESIDAGLRAIARGSDWYGPRLNLAIAYDRLGRADEAIESYAAALAEQPAYPTHMARLIRLCEENGRADDANRFRILFQEAAEARRR